MPSLAPPAGVILVLVRVCWARGISDCSVWSRHSQHADRGSAWTSPRHSPLFWITVRLGALLALVTLAAAPATAAFYLDFRLVSGGGKLTVPANMNGGETVVWCTAAMKVEVYSGHVAASRRLV
jgi:hypothetical protein